MEKVPYEKLLKYPHLRSKEAKIWDRFIEKYPEFFTKVIYDVKVGKGREYPKSEIPQVKENMKYLSKKRIDVVGFIGDDIYIIEVRPRADFSAIGQALGLAELFRDIAPVYKIIIPTIITDEFLPDMTEVSRKMGVKLFLA